MLAQSHPTPPTPPALPGVSGQVVVAPEAAPKAADIYQAFRAQRRVLGQQLEQLEQKRGELSHRLSQPMVGGADRSGLEIRIKEVDQRILSLEKEIAATDAQVSKAAGVHGAMVEEPRFQRSGPPEEVFVMAGLFMVVVLFPLTIAYARRIWRRGSGSAAIVEMPKELGERFTRLEQAVDAIAVEVERVGEGQRYMSRVFTDDVQQRALGAGAALPIEMKEREAAHLRRER